MRKEDDELLFRKRRRAEALARIVVLAGTKSPDGLQLSTTASKEKPESGEPKKAASQASGNGQKQSGKDSKAIGKGCHRSTTPSKDDRSKFALTREDNFMNETASKGNNEVLRREKKAKRRASMLEADGRTGEEGANEGARTGVSHKLSKRARLSQPGHTQRNTAPSQPGNDAAPTIDSNEVKEILGKGNGHVASSKVKRKRRKAEADAGTAKVPGHSKGHIQEVSAIERRRKKSDEEPVTTVTKAKAPLGVLDKMRARLQGGQFRMLNEKLYTCRGDDAFRLFKGDPGAFHKYHAGYKEQIQHWPVKPLDVIIAWLKKRDASLKVADFGCGDAKLAASVKNPVTSLDLVASGPGVIACNMAKTPLETASIDVAVFCLSLMGVDYPYYVAEACRALKPGGWLLIAEVKSRFHAENGGADPSDFLEALSSLGFTLSSQDLSNKMFLLFILKKEQTVKGDGKKPRKVDVEDWPDLKPCVYKRR
eukprot:TRINITY_DN13525_c0_g1_i2.p1 TRINITY_DN13525_c0_g1~~TRINITY_DN13525_c0_g1_i2.p1  ORF type:complete len:481 (-),score=80.85 TRINITY_DN13525_c0_g1_i2:192-1634(-)